MNGAQKKGAFQTYMSRYTLMSVLGITADLDTDGTDGGERVRDDTPPPRQQQRSQSQGSRQYRQAKDGDDDPSSYF